MLVECPKCKTRLKIADEKIADEGTRFKCPKCATVLMVRRPKAPVAVKPAPAAPAPQPRPMPQPAPQPRPQASVQPTAPIAPAPQPKPQTQPTPQARPQGLVPKLALAAHSDPAVAERIKNALATIGYRTSISYDGVDTMIKALKEMPSIAIVDVALPKIYGFEVCKRIKERQETKDMKIILVHHIYDKNRYRREPESMYGGDDHIEDHDIETVLPGKVTELFTLREEEPHALSSAPTPTFQAAPAAPIAPKPATAPPADIDVRARRLVRTILSDIYLYSAQKVEESVKAGNFHDTFSAELKEGFKLYESRIPLEARTKTDYYKEEIDTFIALRKKSLGI